MAAERLAAQTIWRMPMRFGVVRILGRSWLRSVVFHDISSKKSPFTKGINVTTSPHDFKAALSFLAAYYTPVSLEQVLAAEGRALPARAVLVTFDDAYASVAEFAAPLCRSFGVPAVFFVNAAFIDNHRLAPDNLVCYVANTLGLKTINAAAQAVCGADSPELRSLADVFGVLFPSLTFAERTTFLETLMRMAGINERRLAEEASLYLSSGQLRGGLASFGFEIGNHTYSHVHCRSLSTSDFAQEIERNKADLESISGTTVRSFSVPYGSSRDLTGDLHVCLKRSGHEAVFLSESVANDRARQSRLDRVNARASSDSALFLDLEVLPRLRRIRNRLLRRRRFSGIGATIPVGAMERPNRDCIHTLDRP